MDYYKKRAIKNKLIKHRKAIIGTGAFLLTGLVVMIVGFAISGWSIVKWFKDYGITFTVCFAAGLIILFLIVFFYNRFGDRKQ